MALILGIESSCDETGCAIVENGNKILANVVSSQIDLHNEYGGVVPELACRRHIDILIPVIDEALKKAQVKISDIDGIAVAKGPGLIGALLIGINAAKALAFSLQKPLFGINHIEAHIYAAIMDNTDRVAFPCLGVIVSGGHTALIQIAEIGRYQLLGQTIDDAVGEAFDKVATMLSLPYPGGPQIESLAKGGDCHRFPFKTGQVKERPLDFSFSGLKTSVLYTVKGQNKHKSAPLVISEEDKKHVAASFQHTAFMDIINKSILATKSFQCKSIILGGGVTNNQTLRKMFANKLSIPILWPSLQLTLDNAAMIAGLGYHHYTRSLASDGMDLEAMTRIPFDK
jgi:N6-L-threonylcarbamoyladenine synthase